MTDHSGRRRMDASALRAEFDGAFAAPAAARAPDEVALLALRVGAEPFAVRVLDVAGLFAARKIVHVPTRRPELLGIMGLRGAVVPVYGLAQLLGRRAPDDAPRWVLLAGGEERVALAFAELQGHVLAPAGDLDAAAEAEGMGHVREVVRLGGVARPVLDVRSLVRAATRR